MDRVEGPFQSALWDHVDVFGDIAKCAEVVLVCQIDRVDELCDNEWVTVKEVRE